MNDKLKLSMTNDATLLAEDLLLGDDSLGPLFSVAQDSQPEFVDQNFTKMVMNSLPSNPRRGVFAKNTNRSGVSFDLLGLFIGVVCAYMFVEMRTVLEFVLRFIPESLVISPLAMMACLACMVVLSLLAWWSVEHGTKT